MLNTHSHIIHCYIHTIPYICLALQDHDVTQWTMWKRREKKCFDHFGTWNETQSATIISKRQKNSLLFHDEKSQFFEISS